MPDFYGQEYELTYSDLINVFEYMKSVDADYDGLITELKTYTVSLPRKATVVTLDVFSDLLASTQGWKDRVVEIVADAFEIKDKWDALLHDVKRLHEIRLFELNEDPEIKKAGAQKEREIAKNARIPEVMQLLADVERHAKRAERLTKTATGRLENLDSTNQNIKYQFRAIALHRGVNPDGAGWNLDPETNMLRKGD